MREKNQAIARVKQLREEEASLCKRIEILKTMLFVGERELEKRKDGDINATS